MKSLNDSFIDSTFDAELFWHNKFSTWTLNVRKEFVDQHTKIVVQIKTKKTIKIIFRCTNPLNKNNKHTLKNMTSSSEAALCSLPYPWTLPWWNKAQIKWLYKGQILSRGVLSLRKGRGMGMDNQLRLNACMRKGSRKKRSFFSELRKLCHD